MASKEARQLETVSSQVPSDIGQRLRHARQQRGMTLAQVGGSDLTRGFLSSVELGRSSISLKALALVADRLQLPMTYFLTEAEGEVDALPDLLLDDAEAALRSQQPTEALRLLADLDEPPALRSRKLWLQGGALVVLGRPREAIPLLEDALPLAEAGGDLRHLVLVRYTLAMALFGASNYDEALVHLRRAHEQTVSQLDDHALLGKLTVALGHLHYIQGDFTSALGQYARARELFDTVNDLDNLAAVYSGLSRVHRQRGDLRAAVRYSRLGLGIFEARHNQREAAHELSNIAARYEELGETEHALATAHDAVQRAQRSHAPDIEALARSTLAAVHFRLGDMDQARREAHAAQQLGLGEGDLGHIDALVVLAKVADGSGESEQADQLYRAALTALEHNGFHTRYADVALAYSETLRRRDDLAGALQYAVGAAQALAARRA